MTEIEAGKLVVALVTAFPDWMRFLDEEQQKATQKMYRHMMRDLDVEHAKIACARITATFKKPPSIADIREQTELAANGRDPVGLEAWGAVLKAIAKFGRNRIPGHDFHVKDPIVLAVINMLSWRELCTAEDQTSNRARFCDAYDRLAKQAQADRVAGEIAPLPQRRELPRGETRSLGGIVAGLLPEGSTP